MAARGRLHTAPSIKRRRGLTACLMREVSSITSTSRNRCCEFGRRACLNCKRSTFLSKLHGNDTLVKGKHPGSNNNPWTFCHPAASWTRKPGKDVSRPPDAKQGSDEGFLRHLDSYYQEVTSFNYVKKHLMNFAPNSGRREATSQRVKVHHSNRERREKANLEGDNGAFYSLFLPQIPLFNACLHVQPLSSRATFI